MGKWEYLFKIWKTLLSIVSGISLADEPGGEHQGGDEGSQPVPVPTIHIGKSEPTVGVWVPSQRHTLTLVET